jgi:hypothetical protein
MKKMLSEEFTSNDPGKKYKMKIGRSIASALSGFIAGFIVASIGWVAIIYLLQPFCSK